MQNNKSPVIKKDTALSSAEKAIKKFNMEISKAKMDSSGDFFLETTLVEVILGVLGVNELLNESLFKMGTTASSDSDIVKKFMRLGNEATAVGNVKKIMGPLKRLESILLRIKQTPESASFLYDYIRGIGDLGKSLPVIENIQIRDNKISAYDLIEASERIDDNESQTSAIIDNITSAPDQELSSQI